MPTRQCGCDEQPCIWYESIVNGMSELRKSLRACANNNTPFNGTDKEKADDEEWLAKSWGNIEEFGCKHSFLLLKGYTRKELAEWVRKINGSVK